MKVFLLVLALVVPIVSFGAEAPALAPPQVTSHSATLSWTASTTPAVTYNVYRSTTSGSYGTRINPNQVTVRTYSDGSVVAGTRYFYIVRAFLAGSNLESINSNEVTATIPQDPIPQPPPLPGGMISMWPTTIVPPISESSSLPLEVGLQFRSDVAAKVVGVRFYKSSQNTGTHTGSLWSTNGTKLASVTFANETASGWQTANFSTPVDVTAGTLYTVSVFYPRGNFSYERNYFTAQRNAIPLRAPVNAGVFRYEATSAFPSTSYAASNYWVDVVVNTGTTQPPVTVTVAVSPMTVVLQAGASQQFTAAVAGNTNTTVNWSSTIGAINTSGLFTAPNSVGSGTVKATSVADPTKSATANITVTLSPLSVNCPNAQQAITGLRTGDAYTVTVQSLARTANCSGTKQ